MKTNETSATLPRPLLTAPRPLDTLTVWHDGGQCGVTSALGALRMYHPATAATFKNERTGEEFTMSELRDAIDRATVEA